MANCPKLILWLIRFQIHWKCKAVTYGQMSVMKSSTPCESQMHVSFSSKYNPIAIYWNECDRLCYYVLHIWTKTEKKKKNMTQGRVNNSKFFFLLVCCCCCHLRWKYWPVTVIHHFNYIYIDRFINFHSNFCAQIPHIYTNNDSFRCWSRWIFVFESQNESRARFNIPAS